MNTAKLRNKTSFHYNTETSLLHQNRCHLSLFSTTKKFIYKFVSSNLMQKYFWSKKVWPSKVESYLELNALTGWEQEDMISEYCQGA